jgi:hypothetical protein
MGEGCFSTEVCTTRSIITKRRAVNQNLPMPHTCCFSGCSKQFLYGISFDHSGLRSVEERTAGLSFLPLLSMVIDVTQAI